MIRSWSGGHIHGNIVKCSSFFDDSDTSISDTSCCLNIDSDSFGDSFSGNSHEGDDFNITGDSSNAYVSDSEYLVTNKLASIPSDQSKKEFNDMHKTWIFQLQRNLKQRKQQSQENSLRKFKRNTMHRRLIIKEARRKGKVGYDASTKAAKYGKMERPKTRPSVVENNASTRADEEECQRRKAGRARRHKKQLKEYIEGLKEKREMEIVEIEYAREKFEETKRNVTRAVLSKIKAGRSPRDDCKSTHIPPRCNRNEDEQTLIPIETATAMGGRERMKQIQQIHLEQLAETQRLKKEKETETEKQVMEGRERMKQIQQKYLEQFAETQRLRKEKETETEKLKRRLDKRALILKSKYDEKVPSSKLWERKKDDTHDPSDCHNFPTKRMSNDSTRTSCNEGSSSENMKRHALLPSEVAALTERLTKSNQIEGISTVCNDYDQWKRQNGVMGHQKVLSMTGSYPAIRNELFHRGWILNEDRESLFFDLKFTLSSSEIDFANLSRDQIVNHFKSSISITTKTGLIRTLAKAPFFATFYSDQNEFFPRSYDLSSSADICSFIDDSMNLKAEAILIRLLSTHDPKLSTVVNIGVIDILCKIVKRYNRGLGDSSLMNKGFNPLDSLIVHYAETWIHEIVSESELDTDDTFLNLLESFLPKSKDQDSAKKWNYMKKKILDSMARLEAMNDRIISLIKNTLDHSACDKNHPQQAINGSGASNNLWIIKPGGKSRGRGIHVFQNLENLLRHIKPAIDGAKANQYVVQKYIENPLTIQGRKFDIRQWILVTDWNPVTIWFYDDCYIRFAVEEYEGPLESAGNIQSKVGDQWTQNKFRHLVNNSIGKKSSTFKNSFVVEETNSTISGCMWPLKSFREWLLKTRGENIWEESLGPSIKNMAIDSILCAQEDIEAGRKRCFEVYGLDVMIDENLHPWLIEINSSPACDYSTSVSESFVKKALPDILKVVLQDNGSWNNHHIDTNGLDNGGWEQIYRGSSIPKLPASYGSDMTLTGIPLRKPKPAKMKRSKKVPDTLIFDDSDLSDCERSKTPNTKVELPDSATSPAAGKNAKAKIEENKENHENQNVSDCMIKLIKPREETITKVPIPLRTFSLQL